MTETGKRMERAREMLRNAQGEYIAHRHVGRLARLMAVLRRHPDARVEICGDENTGRRFGQAVCRTGRCEKIGHTSRSPAFAGRPYQVWAVWA